MEFMGAMVLDSEIRLQVGLDSPVFNLRPGVFEDEEALASPFGPAYEKVYLARFHRPAGLRVRDSIGVTFGTVVEIGRDGGRCRIRTYDFHRVKVALYR